MNKPKLVHRTVAETNVACGVLRRNSLKKVARLHLGILSVELDKSTPNRAPLTGGLVEGSHKADHYSY